MKRNIIIALVILLMLSGCMGATSTTGPLKIPKEAREALVERVVDGDTFVIDKGQKVRMIGINTPESVDPRRPVEFYGKEASRFTKELLEGKKVYLQWGQTPKDRYGRWLAWVWLPDGTFVNGELVAKGYAQVYTFKDNPEHAEYLLQLQKQAREEKLGLWGKEAGEKAGEKTSSVGFVASKNSKVYHEKGCPGAEGIEEQNVIEFSTEKEAIESGRRMCKVSGCLSQ